MARLFPASLPDYVRRDPLRAAERRVFEALRSGLGDGFTVFYSRPFIGLTPDGREVEGEADFVVAHADYGLLFLEVKGGAVGCDPDSGDWISIDSDGRRHRIKNPVLQAQAAKHGLITKLKKQPALEKGYIPAGIGVVLPASRYDASLSRGADTPEELFAFADQMPHLGNWVRERLADIVKGSPAPLGQVALENVTAVLANRFQLRTPLSAVLAQDDAEVVTLTERQFFILDFLEGHHRAAIGGAAGSGKTLLALEKARRTALSLTSGRILLTCYNHPLAVHLRTVGQPTPNLTIATFHEICGRLATAAGVPLPEPGGEQFYETLLPEALVEAVKRRPELAFDAVVVDEAQDFADEWLDALQLCLKNASTGSFWVFYDDNQRVYPRFPRLLNELPQPPFRLTQNVRNTRRILARAAEYLAPPLPRALGPDGREPEELTVRGNSAARGKLAMMLRRLITDEGVLPEEIAVLATSEPLLRAVLGAKIGEWSVTPADAPRRGQIVGDTVRRFKGLERQVVIVLETPELAGHQELAYIAKTRARLHAITIRVEWAAGVASIAS